MKDCLRIGIIFLVVSWLAVSSAKGGVIEVSFGDQNTRHTLLTRNERQVEFVHLDKIAELFQLELEIDPIDGRIVLRYGDKSASFFPGQQSIIADRRSHFLDTPILKKEGSNLGVDIVSFQSNCEGSLIDFIQNNFTDADGVVINPGALTHNGFSLRDALSDAGLPIIEVHLSNIYAREEWRAKSVIAPIAKGQIAGLGWKGYVVALRILVGELKGETWV